MFTLFKRKSEIDLLQKKYRKALKILRIHKFSDKKKQTILRLSGPTFHIKEMCGLDSISLFNITNFKK